MIVACSTDSTHRKLLHLILQLYQFSSIWYPSVFSGQVLTYSSVPDSSLIPTPYLTTRKHNQAYSCQLSHYTPKTPEQPTPICWLYFLESWSLYFFLPCDYRRHIVSAPLFVSDVRQTAVDSRGTKVLTLVTRKTDENSFDESVRWRSYRMLVCISLPRCEVGASDVLKIASTMFSLFCIRRIFPFLWRCHGDVSHRALLIKYSQTAALYLFRSRILDNVES